jgi:hypothetical protein
MAKDYALRDLGHDIAVAIAKSRETISEWVGSISVETLLYIIVAVFFAAVLLRGVIKFFRALRRQDRQIQEHRRRVFNETDGTE